MGRTYCSCVTSGKIPELAPDNSRPGRYACMGCGATEEVVLATSDAMQEQYTRTGVGAGSIPEHLLSQATLIDNVPGVGPRLTPFKEPAIETLKGSGRSLKEIEQLQLEVTG